MGPFTGSATLQRKVGNYYVGDGQFAFLGSLPLTSVTNCRVSLDKYGKTGTAEGQWTEAGITYNLEILLQRVGAPQKSIGAVPDYLIGPQPDIQLEQKRSASHETDPRRDISQARSALKKERDKEKLKAKKGEIQKSRQTYSEKRGS